MDSVSFYQNKRCFDSLYLVVVILNVHIAFVKVEFYLCMHVQNHISVKNKKTTYTLKTSFKPSKKVGASSSQIAGT